MGGKVSGTLSKRQKSTWPLTAWKGGSWEDTKISNCMTCIVFQATEPTECSDIQKIQWTPSSGLKCLFFFHFVYICSRWEHVCDVCFDLSIHLLIWSQGMVTVAWAQYSRHPFSQQCFSGYWSISSPQELQCVTPSVASESTPGSYCSWTLPENFHRNTLRRSWAHASCGGT